MRKVLFIYMVAAVCALVIPANARPAAPGFQTVSNKDGSSVSIRHFGDEHYHYTETSDGMLVTGNGDGSYVYVGEDGTASDVIAKNVADRTSEEKSFLNSLNQEAVHQKHQELNGGRFPEEEGLNENESFSHAPLMSYNQDGVSTMMLRRPTSEKWTTGERWFPVLLIGTTDKAHGDSAEFYSFLNQPGYTKNNNVGSLRDYFLYVSDSLFNPHFDVYPITLNKALTDFGTGDNFKEGQFTAMGIDSLVKRKDFLANAKKYCMKNSSVDGFIFLFPGMEQDALKQSELFWGHQFWMQSNGSTYSAWGYPPPYTAGGYSFDKYLFIAQYADGSRNSKINKMGIFAHEFSHVMGLNDHYGKDSNNRQVDGPGAYDVMSLGMYNGTTFNEGNAPMGYSAYEKEIMGWLKLTELEADKVYSLKKLSEMQAYSVTNPNQNDEYYIVEYRPAESYDSYIKSSINWNQRGNGVYVWYIDYDRTICMTNNNANGDVNHQRVAINSVLAANGYYADFTYVNKNGKSSVPGVYNIVLDGNERACFTTSQGMSLTACPEESSSSVASSSSIASSSSVARSSSSIARSSSSVKSSSSQTVLKSSSSEKLESSSSSAIMGIAATASMSQVQFLQEGRLLHVLADVPGLKSVRLFDMQGHLLYSEKFSGSAVTLDLGGVARGAFVVRLTVGSKVIAVKKINL